MARFAVAAVAICAACYAPLPPQGAPCDDDKGCPTGQACIAGHCGGGRGTIDGSIGKGDGPDAMPTPTDLDADGVLNTADNCPNTANANQYNEDGDALGDACDPCPIDPANPPSDPDGDGVSDSCDPRPTTPGDSIVLFEGFHAGVPANWQVSGMTVQSGDDVVIVGQELESSIVPPIAAPTNGVVMAKVKPTGTVGANDASLAVVLPFDAANGGIYCELYSPSAGSTNNRALDLYDLAPNSIRGTKPYGWQVNTSYTLALKRTNTSYVCSASPTDQVTGSSTSTVGNPRVAVFSYAVTAAVSWLLVVKSG